MFKNIVNNRLFFLITLTCLITFFSIISFPNLSFDLYFNQKYYKYAKSLSAYLGFISPVNSNDLTTFPIWGYGLIHWIFKSSKLSILIFQQLLNFFCIYLLDNYIKKYHFTSLSYWRILVLLAFPYFLFHTQLWPKSVASSLLIIGFIKILDYLNSEKKSNILVSGILFGLVCNFRSDYFYLVMVLPMILILWQIFIQKKVIWFSSLLFIPIIIILSLTPWSYYSFKKINKYIVTSTNAGHTLFIGLGQLPDNAWGITPRDDDPKMKKILNSKFKTSNILSTNYSESQYLKKIFFQYVMNNPYEWIKKCFHNIRLILMDPFYVGNIGDFQKNGISNIQEIRALENAFYRLDFENTYKILKDTNWNFSFNEILQLLATIITKLIGVLFFLTTIGLSTYVAIFDLKWFFRSPINLLLTTILVYQLAILILIFHMPVYNTSIFLIYLVILSLLIEKIFFNHTINNDKIISIDNIP